MEFTQQDIQQLIYFLNKCKIDGNEAVAFAILYQKLNAVVAQASKGSE